MAHPSEKLLDAIDLSHHLSDLAKRRGVSPLKELQKLLPLIPPDSIPLAGGLPDPEYFPFASIGGEVMAPDSFALRAHKPASSGAFTWLWNIFGASKDKPETITIPRYPAASGDLSLAEALQYGPAVGVAALQKFLDDYVRVATPPAYKDWTTLVHVGNTDGWSRCVLTFCNYGDVILTEEWTYVSALSTAKPYGVNAVPVAMDAEGMSAVALEELLSTWDEASRGAKRPHLMYTVPVGQNPCGMTMTLQRKKEIYDICVKYDVVIIEDDPYYFLQEGNYVPKADRTSNDGTFPSNPQEFLKSLVPSYVTMDYQGRVIRLDTFSKTIAPGARMGFFTCNPLFAERLERQGETASQRPSGFAMALITQLLTKQWGLDGYVRWVGGLRAQYTARRDAAVDALLTQFDAERGYTDASYFVQGLPQYSLFPNRKHSSKRADTKQAGRLASFVPPTSGMFVWMNVHFGSLPPAQEDPNDPENKPDHESRLWFRMAKAGLLVAPGAFFASAPEVTRTTTDGHYRIAFSMGPLDNMTRAAEIFAREVHSYFEDVLSA